MHYVDDRLVLGGGAARLTRGQNIRPQRDSWPSVTALGRAVRSESISAMARDIDMFDLPGFDSSDAEDEN